MKVKQGKIMLLSLIAAFITFFSLSLLNLTDATARAEGVSATFVRTDTATGAAWEGIYGKQGYVVIGNTEKGYYSDMYDGNDGKTEIISTTSGIKESATISRWDHATTAWGSSDNIGAYKIYKPGTTEILTKARFHNGWGNAFNDSGIMFTLKSDDEIFVSLCVVDWDNKVSETQPITIGVFNNYRKLSQAITNVNKYYAGSAESAPLATATVTSQTTYVTFKLAGAGDYEIIGYYDNQDQDTSTAKSPVVPMVLGFFFDNELSQAVKYTNSINYYGQDWESSPYGKNGYIVMGETETIYSDLYVDNASDDISAEHSSAALTTVGRSHGDQNTYLTVDGKVISSYAPITKWAFCSQNWGAFPDVDWAGAAKTRSLYKPNSTEQVNARLDNGWSKNSDKSQSPGDMSYIIHREKIDTVYITLYVIDMQGADNILADLRVYRNAKTNPNGGSVDIDSFYGTKLLYRQTITKTQSYVTLELNGNGDFQIVLSRHKNNEGTYDADGYGSPMITGLFFDSEDPTKASINDVSLTLDGTVGLNFYTKIPGAYENAAMRFTYADGATETVHRPATLTDGYYKFTAKVLPKNYAQKVKAELVSGDTVLDIVEYSVKDYCDYVAANSSDEKLKSLCASLANYGAAADNYFNNAQNQITETTVTAEDLKGYQATAQGNAPDGVEVNEISLIIESETSIRLYITSPDDVVVTVDGSEAQIKTDGSGKYIEIANIAAKNLDKVYEITIGDSYVIKCSALTYVYEVLSRESSEQLKVVANALYLYNQAANAYFE